MIGLCLMALNHSLGHDTFQWGECKHFRLWLSVGVNICSENFICVGECSLYIGECVPPTPFTHAAISTFERKRTP